MKADLVLKGGTLVIPGQGLMRAGVVIQADKITAVVKDALLPRAQRVIDVRGRLVLPGIIDPHVHFGLISDLGDDVRTESRSALAGGVTTVGVFIREPESHLATFYQRTRIFESSSAIDIFPHFDIVSEAQVPEIPKCAKRCGVTSYKNFFVLNSRKTAG